MFFLLLLNLYIEFESIRSFDYFFSVEYTYFDDICIDHVCVQKKLCRYYGNSIIGFENRYQANDNRYEYPNDIKNKIGNDIFVRMFAGLLLNASSPLFFTIIFHPRFLCE